MIELPHAVVFYLKDSKTTLKSLRVILRVPNETELEYTIPTEKMSDYTPVELLEQDKFPLFPFYMANFKGNNPEKFEREWLEGCAKLHELVGLGRIERAEALRLLEDGRTIIKKVKHPKKEEVFREMESMHEVVGVGIDWIEIKRRNDQAIAQAVSKTRIEERKAAARERMEERKAAERKKTIAIIMNALGMGFSLDTIASLVNLPQDEVIVLIKKHKNRTENENGK